MVRGLLAPNTSQRSSVARSPFSLYRRPPKGILYVQIFDFELRKYLPGKSTGTSNLIQARKFAKGLLEKRKGANDSSSRFVDYLSEFWDYAVSPYIRAQLLRRPNGITRSYTTTNRSFIRRYAAPFFKQVLLQEVHPSSLEEFLVHLLQSTHLAPKSINSVYDAVAIPLREAFRLGKISSDPTRSIRKLWVPHLEKGIPTSEEVRRLSALIWEDERAAVAFHVAVLCGLRLGEVRALKRESIGADRLRVDFSYSPVDGLKSPKNGRSRVVPLPSFLRDQLIKLAEKNPHRESWVFWGKRPGRPVCPKVLVEGFFKALDEIGVDEDSRKVRRITFHSLRHYCNSMLRGALPDEKLRLLTGHMTSAMTERYDHVTDRDWLVMTGAQLDRLVNGIFGGVA